MTRTLELCPVGVGRSARRRAEPNHDFDFLHGSWVVENRRLPALFAETDDWLSFETVHACRPLLNGRGNICEVEAEDDEPFAMLHMLDRAAGRWAVHMLTVEGTMQPPLRGRFRAGVGSFVGRWYLGGRSLLVHHAWTGTPEMPQWAQAFSKDGGRTWKTNWTMKFARVHWPA